MLTHKGDEITMGGDEITMGGDEITMGGDEITMGGDEITMGAHVGAPLRGRPSSSNERPSSSNERPSSSNERPCPSHERPFLQPGVSSYGNENIKYGATVGDAVDWFKTMTTNEYIRGVKKSGWQAFNGKLWQRNYWEHIIRNENEYNRISQYIKNNPCNWGSDKLNGGNGNCVMETIAAYGEEIWMM